MPPAAVPPAPAARKSSAQDDKLLAMLCHLSFFFLSIIFPLVIYLVKKDDGSDFLMQHAKESLNFHITIVLVCIALCITIIGIALVPVVSIFGLIMTIIATIKTSELKEYRYPFCLRLVN